MAKEIKEKLKCNLMGTDYKYPIGLDVGLDQSGLVCFFNLLFEFKMIFSGLLIYQN